MNLSALFDLLDNDVTEMVMKKLRMIRMEEEMKKRWDEKLAHVYETKCEYLFRQLHPGRFSLRKEGRYPISIDDAKSWVEVDGQMYTMANKYWIGGRLLKPKRWSRHSPSVGLTLIWNSNDIEEIVDELQQSGLIKVVQHRVQETLGPRVEATYCVPTTAYRSLCNLVRVQRTPLAQHALDGLPRLGIAARTQYWTKVIYGYYREIGE